MHDYPHSSTEQEVLGLDRLSTLIQQALIQEQKAGRVNSTIDDFDPFLDADELP